MICFRFRRMMHEQLDGALSPEDMETLMRHISQCRRCARHWHALNASIGLLKHAVQADEHLRSIPVRAIEQRLQVQLSECKMRELCSPAPSKAQHRIFPPRRIYVSALGALGLLIILGVIFTVSQMYRSRQRQRADYSADAADMYTDAIPSPRYKTLQPDVTQPTAGAWRFDIPRWNYKQTRIIGNVLVSLTVRREGHCLEGQIVIEPLQEASGITDWRTPSQYPSTRSSSPFLLTCADGSRRLPSQVSVDVRGDARVFTVNWRGIGRRQLPASIFIAHAAPLATSITRSPARVKQDHIASKAGEVAVVKVEGVAYGLQFDQAGAQRRSLQVTLRLEPIGNVEISNVIWEPLSKAIDDTGCSLLRQRTPSRVLRMFGAGQIMRYTYTLATPSTRAKRIAQISGAVRFDILKMVQVRFEKPKVKHVQTRKANGRQVTIRSIGCSGNSVYATISIQPPLQARGVSSGSYMFKSSSSKRTIFLPRFMNGFMSCSRVGFVLLCTDGSRREPNEIKLSSDKMRSTFEITWHGVNPEVGINALICEVPKVIKRQRLAFTFKNILLP